MLIMQLLSTVRNSVVFIKSGLIDKSVLELQGIVFAIVTVELKFSFIYISIDEAPLGGVWVSRIPLIFGQNIPYPVNSYLILLKNDNFDIPESF